MGFRHSTLDFRLVCALLLLVSGCITPWERQALIGSRAGIGNVQGPTERRLRNILKLKNDKDGAEDSLIDESGSLKPIPGTEDYIAAEKLYDDGDFKAAEAAFHKVGRKHRPPGEWTRDLVTGHLYERKPKPNDSIREDALFKEAESAYKQQHYADANDVYAGLLKDYPSTRHLDDVTKRLFEIARLWLDFPQDTGLNEVAQVNFDDFHRRLPAEDPPDHKRTPVFVPNFTNEERPTFDSEGNAISALRLIWLNDPTGPLADDSLMMTASYYARRGNWIEADRHYTMLREEYPNSPHVQTAFVLGSHVKLMSYEGPVYDGKTLEDAQHLKESTLRLYPASEDRQRIEKELEKIEEAKAGRLWAIVELYANKRKPRSEAIYCHLVIERFPESIYADRARERLQKLGPDYANGEKFLTAVDDPPWKLWADPGSAFKPRDPPRLFGVVWAEPGSYFKQHRGAVPVDAAPQPDRVAESEPQRPSSGERPGSTSKRRSEGESQPRPDSTKDVPLEEDEAKEPRSRWNRLLRFTPPKRLAPNEDAKPNTVDDAADDVGRARL